MLALGGGRREGSYAGTDPMPTTMAMVSFDEAAGFSQVLVLALLTQSSRARMERSQGDASICQRCRANATWTALRGVGRAGRAPFYQPPAGSDVNRMLGSRRPLEWDK